MNYKTILITGGAGFVGSHLALTLKRNYSHITIVVLDNLKRRGSELNLARLQKEGVTFVHGDIRIADDFVYSHPIDLIIDASAEPSVLAGVNESPMYVLQTNLWGTINALECARRHKADFLFLSTSRVYPIEELSNIDLIESDTRFTLAETQSMPGVSKQGISEQFPMGTVRSIYGATKLNSEMLVHEYRAAYGMHAVIMRSGVITGPWQMGKVDQGVFALWVARHIWPEKPVSYIGFNGSGKQVRDFIHIDDLYTALDHVMNNRELHNGETYNIGGGVENSLSLLEMTSLCQTISGTTISVIREKQLRVNDIPLYITDYSKFNKKTGWRPKNDAHRTVEDIYTWMISNKKLLTPLFS